jgi:hypothetical protein
VGDFRHGDAELGDQRVEAGAAGVGVFGVGGHGEFLDSGAMPNISAARGVSSSPA